MKGIELFLKIGEGCASRIKTITHINEKLKKEKSPPKGSEALRFGDYCIIEQKRYGVPNESFVYKVITRGVSNHWRSVPVDACNTEVVSGGSMEECVLCLCCGISEEDNKLEKFRCKDVKPFKEGI